MRAIRAGRYTACRELICDSLVLPGTSSQPDLDPGSLRLLVCLLWVVADAVGAVHSDGGGEEGPSRRRKGKIESGVKACLPRWLW